MQKKTFYVCSSLNNGKLFNKIISASSFDEADLLFSNQYKLKAEEILGPFYKKSNKTTSLNININSLKFTNQTKRALYNDWIVDAFLLLEPKEHAYLIFVKNKNGNSKITNKNIVVPISDLRFLNG